MYENKLRTDDYTVRIRCLQLQMGYAGNTRLHVRSLRPYSVNAA